MVEDDRDCGLRVLESIFLAFCQSATGFLI